MVSSSNMSLTPIYILEIITLDAIQTVGKTSVRNTEPEK